MDEPGLRPPGPHAFMTIVKMWLTIHNQLSEIIISILFRGHRSHYFPSAQISLATFSFRTTFVLFSFDLVDSVHAPQRRNVQLSMGVVYPCHKGILSVQTWNTVDKKKKRPGYRAFKNVDELFLFFFLVEIF